MNLMKLLQMKDPHWSVTKQCLGQRHSLGTKSNFKIIHILVLIKNHEEIKNNSLKSPFSPVCLSFASCSTGYQCLSLQLFNLPPTFFPQYFPLSKHFTMYIGLECSLSPFPLLFICSCSLFFILSHKKPKINFAKHRRDRLGWSASEKIKANLPLMKVVKI